MGGVLLLKLYVLVDDVAIQECHDLCARAGILRAEFRRTHTVRNAVLHGPQNGAAVIRASTHVGKRIARAGRRGLALVAPEERDVYFVIQLNNIKPDLVIRRRKCPIKKSVFLFCQLNFRRLTIFKNMLRFAASRNGNHILMKNADLLISVFLTDIKPCLNRAIIFGLKPIIRLCLIFRLTHLRRKISSLKISVLICIIQSLRATL